MAIGRRLMLWVGACIALTLVVVLYCVQVRYAGVTASNDDRQIRPLDSEGVRELATVSRMKLRWLKRFDGSGREDLAEVLEVNNDDPDFERLILLLAPVMQRVEGPLGTPDFEIRFAAGNRYGPTIRVKCVSDEIQKYEFRGTVYTGGDASRFRALADKIFSESRSK